MNPVATTYTDSWDNPEYSLTEGRGPNVPRARPDDLRVVEKLRGGDEEAFTDLVNRYHASMLRLATAYVTERSVAEEVVQDTWMGVLEGLDRFEGRSSLKTWIFSILTNKAKTRGVRERRSIPVSSLTADDGDGDEPAVDPSRFQSSGHWQDYWSAYPESWDDKTPEKRLLDQESATLLGQAIEALSPRLKQIIVMRDIEGLESQEVCAILSVSEANQRVLLHRARSRVRKALEDYVGRAKRK